MIYAFGEFELDQGLYEVRHAGCVVRIEPKVFDVVAYLVAHRDRLVSKDELLEQLWPGQSVSESVLPRCITAARKALADDSGRQRVIQTVHGRGYRFVAPVRVIEAAASVTPQDAAAAAPGRASERQPAVFVGRQRTMETLRVGLDDARAGRGRVLLLVGEPGIGKSRTAEELGVVARGRGARVLTGRCHESAGAPAFWPWVQILRTLVGETPGLVEEAPPGAADAVQLVPELGDRLPREPAPPVLPPEQARFRLFDGVTRFFKHAAAAQPLVLVLDDLHWADKPSLLLLQFLAREIRDAPILVIATYRDVELRRQHPLAGVLGELAREALCSRLALRGLTAADVAQYLEASVGRPPVARVVAALHEMTEGNPFFLGEIVRLLVAEGRLERGEAALEALALPQGVREAIGRRLNGLSEACNRILRQAAVIGREFHLPAVERVTECSRGELLELLDEARGARILVKVPGTVAAYAFSHALIRDTLYEELATPLRVRLHRRVAEVLEELARVDPGARLAEIAHHFFQAAPGGDVARAVRYCVRAAERAMQLLAYEEAVEHYERALQLCELEPAEDGERAELLLALGEAESCSGDRDQARATFARAAAVARASGDAGQLARAALGFGGRGEMGMPRDDALRSLLEEALQALGVEHDGLRARVLARLVGAPPYYESLETRMALSAQAVELARRLDDPPTLLKALTARCWAMLGPDHVAERLGVAAEMLRLAEAIGDRASEFHAREYRFGCALALGDIPAADREIAAAARLAEEIRQPVYGWFIGWWQASRALSDGRFDDAERLRHEALAVGERIRHPGARAIFAGQGLWLSGQRGAPEDAFQAGFDFLLDYYPRAGVNLRAGEAMLYGQTGRVAEARAAFETLAARDFADLPRDEHWLSAVTVLAEVCAAVGDGRRAAILYELLLPFAERNAVHDLLRAHAGSVAHYLALLAAALGRPADAARHFERALAMNARMGARPAVAYTQYEYARTLLERGRASRAKARELLAACAAGSATLGMGQLERKVRELRARAEETAPSADRRGSRG